MAAVEARAAWQRAANRYFVQDDAKRAPKLACCSSSSVPASKSQVSAGTSGGKNPLDPRVAGFMPLGWKLSNSSLSTDTKWWLQLQPNSAYQKDFNFEQLNPLETELELLRAKEVSEALKFCEDPDKCSIQSFTSKSNESSLDPKIQYERTEPWWRVADKDELAFFVAQKSLEHIENCDLPPVRNKNSRNCSFCPDSFCKDGFFSSTLDQEARVGLSYGVSGENTDKPFRYSADRTSHETERSREQLMEALRHSQTRAREAEKAISKASSEKDRVIELIFKQASDLFAYNQWIQLLQQANKSNRFETQEDRSIFATHIPVVPPFNCKQRRNDITKNAVAFAVGLGLVSAGLLLGWTIGWLLPRL